MKNTATVHGDTIYIDRGPDRQEPLRRPTWQLAGNALKGARDGWLLTISPVDHGQFRLRAEDPDGLLYVGGLTIVDVEGLTRTQPRARSWAIAHARRSVQRALASASALAFAPEHDQMVSDLLAQATATVTLLQRIRQPAGSDPAPLCA